MNKMFKILQFSLLLMSALVSCTQEDAATEQLVIFKDETKASIGRLTTSTGAPVETRDADSTLNTNLLLNEHFIESLAHLVRENIPVRVVHPVGYGAFGYFETTHDISHICKAELFSQVGKKTPVAARLSMGVVQKGGSDLTREARGFSVKHYTKEGNFDIAGFNTPVFVVKDPRLFGTFAHAIKRNPVTDFTDPNATWDFLTLNPESLHMFLTVFGDPGIPDGYRHMPGFSIHTYQVYNKHGHSSYVRFHYRPDCGMKNLNSSEAARLGALDPNYSARDLYTAIANGNYPSWTVSIQVLSPEDVKKASFDVFDVTKSLPESLYPLHPIGRMVLNRNPTNYFADIEQMAFCPANVVPGILGAPDKTFESRRFSYRDSQRYRLGSNFDKILVNSAYRSKVLTYNRDGVSPVYNNENSGPNYYPNSFNGAVSYKDANRPNLTVIYEKPADNFEQSRDYYNQMSTGERDRFVENALVTLCHATPFLQKRALEVFNKIDRDLRKRTAQALQYC